jgi:6-phosphogluconolactonase (cycloisomerase 2 family)
VVTDPSGRFLFVSRSGGRGGIDVFGINGQSGVLTLAAGAPFDVDHQADSLVADPSGRFLFAVRTFNFATESFAIDPTSGALSSSPGRRLDLDDAPTAPVLRPDGRVLYYGAGSGARVRSASVDTVTGLLIQGGSTEVQDNVRALAVAPTGSFLYVTTATPLSSNTLFAYRITQATGALTSLSGTAFASGFDAAGTNFRPDTVAFDPVGRFAYILDRPGRTGAHSRGVFVFPLQSTGLFGPSVLGPFSTPPTEPFLNGDPVAFVLDPSGRFAYIADATSGTISAFTIDPLTGSLSPSGPPIAASGIAGAPLIAITP